jgi:hypothetical protein
MEVIEFLYAIESKTTQYLQHKWIISIFIRTYSYLCNIFLRPNSKGQTQANSFMHVQDTIYVCYIV